MSRIFQINTSRGGVPKLAVAAADVTALGIVGDGHRHKDIHGGPERALCLYSLEQMLALQEEGHPVFPGSIGENILTAGLDLSAIVPGNRLRLGNDVEVEITSYTLPCKTIAAAFRNREFSRISQKVHPGWSRLYTRILREGRIAAGDPVRLIP